MVSVRCDVDNVLHLGVIEQKTVYRTIAALYEMASKSSNIKSPHSLLASVPPSDELNKSIWIVGIKINNLDPDQ